MKNTATWSGRDMLLFGGDRLKFDLNTGCLSDEFRDFSSVSPGKSAIVPHIRLLQVPSKIVTH